MGGDETPEEKIGAINVSIHAPAWGATPALQWQCEVKMFQSTPPHGGRLELLLSIIMIQRFQSTPPHGGRHEAASVAKALEEVSIHAPAWGATVILQLIKINKTISHFLRTSFFRRIIYLIVKEQFLQPLYFQHLPHNANLPGNSRELQVRKRPSNYQRTFLINGFFCPNMFYAASPVGT